MSTEREAFEAWYAGHWAQATGKTQPLAEVAAIVVTMRDGEYYDDGDGDGARPPYINNLWSGWKARAALSTPPAAVRPVALHSVELTRDVHGMCVVKVNGREAIRDNGDIIDHMATLDWFSGNSQGTAKWFEENEPMPSQDQLLREVESLREANSAAIVPDGMVLVPRDLIGAACGAIRFNLEAPVVLAKLRRYTTGDLSSPPQEQPHDE